MRKLRVRPKNNRSMCPYCRMDIYDIDDWIYCSCLNLNVHDDCIKELSKCDCHARRLVNSIEYKRHEPLVKHNKSHLFTFIVYVLCVMISLSGIVFFYVGLSDTYK